MPKLSRTNTTVSGAVTRNVAPYTSANTAIEIGDWSIAIQPNTTMRAANAAAVGHTGPRRSLARPDAMTPARPVNPISASRLPGHQRAQAAILRERHHMGGDEEIVEAADRVDRQQQPELPLARRLAQRKALARRSAGVPLRPAPAARATAAAAARCATPIQMNTERQPICTITAASTAIIMSCPTLMPETATALASPARPG